MIDAQHSVHSKGPQKWVCSFKITKLLTVVSIFSTYDIKTNYKTEYQVQGDKTVRTMNESQNLQCNWFVTSLENLYFCAGNSKLNLISC